MKKLLITFTSLVVLSAASQAFAKTEGSSVGVTVFKANVNHRSSLAPDTTFRESEVGFGLNYKYAVSIVDNFYIAPGLSYDHIGTSVSNSSTSTGTDKVNVNNRYSARADIGYDVNNTLALYAVVGYSAISAEVYNGSEKKNTTRNFAPLFGFGAKTAICKNFDLTFEYTNQHANLHTSTPLERAKTKLETYGIGLAYNF